MAGRTVSASILGALLAATLARGGEARLAAETTLRASPSGGEVLGMLGAEAPVTELERQGDWVRVRVEGWVKAGSLAPAVSPVAAARVATLEGTVEVKLGGGLRKKRLNGSGQQVWLVPAGFDLEGAGKVSAEDAARLQQLDAEAARLSKEAVAALQGSNFSESTKRHDALMSERHKVLRERAGMLAEHHGRREAAAREAALETASCDARGFFLFPAIGPGPYRVYARLVDREVDLEWIEDVEVGAAGSKLRLDETRARGLIEEPGE